MKAKRKERDWEAVKALGSYCTCGHIGDKTNSDHIDPYGPNYGCGHGACKKCQCQRFSWAGFVAEKKKRTA